MSASDEPISKLTVTFGYVFLKSTQKSSASYPAQSRTVRLPVNSPGGTSVAGAAAPQADKIKARASINPSARNSIDRFGFILLILSNKRLKDTNGTLCGETSCCGG